MQLYVMFAGLCTLWRSPCLVNLGECLFIHGGFHQLGIMQNYNNGLTFHLVSCTVYAVESACKTINRLKIKPDMTQAAWLCSLFTVGHCLRRNKFCVVMICGGREM
jgi:hypothetical protein